MPDTFKGEPSVNSLPSTGYYGYYDRVALNPSTELSIYELRFKSGVLDHRIPRHFIFLQRKIIK